MTRPAFPPKRVLVTGGAGFIGSRLVERLAEESYRVAVMDNLSTGRASNLAPAIDAGLSKDLIFEADVRTNATDDIVTWWKPDAIVHLAAQSHVQASMRDPRADLDINVLGLARLLQAAHRAGVPRLVVASSGGTIYGERINASGPTSEQTACVPLSFYGLSKHVGDQLARLYQRHFGLEYVSLALGNVYGPNQNPYGESRVLSIFAHRLVAGLNCEITGDGSAIRDYVHVNDAVDAFEKALRRGSGLINIGTGVGTSLISAYRMLAVRAQVNRPPVFVPVRAGEVQAIVLDPAKAADQLDWRPTVALPQGLDELIAAARRARPIANGSLTDTTDQPQQADRGKRYAATSTRSGGGCDPT